jgi:hypothetical protein
MSRSIVFALLVILLACSALAVCSPKEITLADVPRISVEEVYTKLNAGEQVTIVDVRGVIEFEELHIAGAYSIPLLELEDRLQELPRQGLIVPY